MGLVAGILQRPSLEIQELGRRRPWVVDAFPLLAGGTAIAAHGAREITLELPLPESPLERQSRETVWAQRGDSLAGPAPPFGAFGGPGAVHDRLSLEMPAVPPRSSSIDYQEERAR